MPSYGEILEGPLLGKEDGLIVINEDLRDLEDGQMGLPVTADGIVLLVLGKFFADEAGGHLNGALIITRC